MARPLGRRTLGVLVAERRRPHVTQADAALAAAVHQRVAVVGVELSRRDDLRQVLHVGRLDVHDVWKGGVRGQGEDVEEDVGGLFCVCYRRM